MRHAITILQFPNELSTEQDKICETSMQDPSNSVTSSTSSARPPRLVCGTVIMFTASVSSSDAQRLAMTSSGGSLRWAGQEARE
jgi:hypothetical protein